MATQDARALYNNYKAVPKRFSTLTWGVMLQIGVFAIRSISSRRVLPIYGKRDLPKGGLKKHGKKVFPKVYIGGCACPCGWGIYFDNVQFRFTALSGLQRSRRAVLRKESCDFASQRSRGSAQNKI